MNVNVPIIPVRADVPLSSFDQEESSAAADGIKTNALVYSEAVRGFLKSADIEAFTASARGIAKELTGPDGRVNNWILPYNLTPLHIACLARDSVLLQSALDDARCLASIDQCTVALKEDKLAVSVGNEQMPGMNQDPALHFALFTGWNEGALLLIDALKSQDKLEHTVNNTGNSVLNLAAGKCSLEVLLVLCEHFRDSENYKSYLFHKTDNDSSLLHHAVQQDDPAVLRYLLDQQLQTGQNCTFCDQDKGGKIPWDMIVDKALNIIEAKVGKRYNDQQLKTDNNLRDSLFTKQYFNEPWLKYCMEDMFNNTRSMPVPFTRALNWWESSSCIIA